MREIPAGSDYFDFTLEEGTDPGNRTFIGPIIESRPPAVVLASAKAGHTIRIPPKRGMRIPWEWGQPEVSLTAEMAERKWTPDGEGTCMVCGRVLEDHGYAVRRRPCQ